MKSPTVLVMTHWARLVIRFTPSLCPDRLSIENNEQIVYKRLLEARS